MGENSSNFTNLKKKFEFGTVANEFQLLLENILSQLKKRIRTSNIQCGNSVGLQTWRFEVSLRWGCIAYHGLESARHRGSKAISGNGGKKAKVSEAGMNKWAPISATILAPRGFSDNFFSRGLSDNFLSSNVELLDTLA